MDKLIEHADIDTKLAIAKITGANVWKKIQLPDLDIPTSPYFFRYFTKEHMLIYIDVDDYVFAVYKDIAPIGDGYWSPCYFTETWRLDSGNYAILGSHNPTPFMFAGNDRIISV